MSSLADHYASAVCDRTGPVPIRWDRVEPESLPDGSLVRAALEDGRADVAAWLAENARGTAYFHTEATYRTMVYEREAREAVENGMSAREAERRYGVCRDRL